MNSKSTNTQEQASNLSGNASCSTAACAPFRSSEIVNSIEHLTTAVGSITLNATKAHIPYTDVGAAIKRQQALLETLNGLSSQLSDAIKDTVRSSASFRTDQDTFREKDRVKVIIRNTELYKDTDSRTLGFLDKSYLHGVVYARSGMKSRKVRNLINSGVYTTLALSIMRETEFPIKGHKFDKLGRGSFYACHVEAQLIAYFIRALQANEANKQKNSIKEGAAMNLQADQRRARICVNRAPCRNCQDFGDHCERVFDVTITLVDMDVFPEPALTL